MDNNWIIIIENNISIISNPFRIEINNTFALNCKLCPFMYLESDDKYICLNLEFVFMIATGYWNCQLYSNYLLPKRHQITISTKCNIQQLVSKMALTEGIAIVASVVLNFVFSNNISPLWVSRLSSNRNSDNLNYYNVN